MKVYLLEKQLKNLIYQKAQWLSIFNFLSKDMILLKSISSLKKGRNLNLIIGRLVKKIIAMKNM
jgi:hypothetical protein